MLVLALGFALFFLLQDRKTSPRPIGEPDSRQLKWFALAAVCLVLPRVIYAMQNPSTFASTDIFSYMKDSNLFLTGRLPISSKLWNEDPYYASFPVVAMLITIVRSVTGLDVLITVHVINTVVQALFWLSVWLVMTKVLNVTAPRFLSLAIVLVGFSNPYLYGYFDTLLPQNVGLAVILLLLYTSLKSGLDFGVTYTLLLVFGLVHVSVIPVFLTIALMLKFTAYLQTKRVGFANPRPTLTSRLIAPALAFVAYLLLSASASDTLGRYARYVLLFFQQAATQVTMGNASILAGLPRGDFLGIDALAASLIVGSTLAFAVSYLYALLKRRERNTDLAGIAIVALALMSAAAFRQRLDVFGAAFFSISRYFATPGYALGAIVACWQLAIILSRRRVASEMTMLYGLLALSAIGGLLDPLAHLIA